MYTFYIALKNCILERLLLFSKYFLEQIYKNSKAKFGRYILQLLGNFKATRMEKLKAMMSPKNDESNKKPQEDDMSSTKTSLNDAQGGNILNNTSSVI